MDHHLGASSLMSFLGQAGLVDLLKKESMSHTKLDVFTIKLGLIFF